MSTTHPFNRPAPHAPLAGTLVGTLAWTLSAALLAGLLLAPSAQAATTCSEDNQNGCTDLSPTPPQQTTAIPPNIVLLLDDSGSMNRSIMPDSGYITNDYHRIDSYYNGVYYNPDTEYLAPPKANSTSAAPSFYTTYEDITEVPRNGFNSSGTKDNLTTTDVSPSVGTKWTKEKIDDVNLFRYAVGPSPTLATLRYVANGDDCPESLGSRCVSVEDTSGVAAPPGVRVGTNIANWYAYYHTRILMAKSGLMTALINLSPNYRFGFGAINNSNSGNLASPKYTGSDVEISQVRPFGDGTSSTQKAGFWKWLDSMAPSGNTPLRRALYSAGKYYETDQAWKTMPGDPNHEVAGDNDQELACRASYTILTTDGFWNGSAPDDAVKGEASTAGTVFISPLDPTVKAGYKNELPFSGGGASSKALADVAAYFWKRDLRAGTANLVPTSANDPAFWQHMTTFTMGIGFEPVYEEGGALLPVDELFAWARGGPAVPGFQWPVPSSNNIKNIADMLHAAVTGHGNFFSATNPQELADGFAKAIAQISERTVAPQPKSANASVAVTGALTFNTGYNTSDWTGTLEAVEMDRDGISGDTIWDVTAKLDAMSYSSRKVYTAVYEGVDCSDPANAAPAFEKGIQFTSTNSTELDCLQTAGLASPALGGGQDTLNHRIDFLLGDDSYESGQPGGIYRSRTHRLGAIINSQPVYVSYPSGGYYNIWPSGSPESLAVVANKGYNKFVADHKEREGTLYVGANDGMLHAFSAPAPDCNFADPTNVTCTYGNGGDERWAFVPRAVYANLGNLTALDFRYRPTVDAIPRSRDVFIKPAGAAAAGWHTLLAAGVGLGGRGVYALDITDPENFTAGDVLWEFDADMTPTATCKSIVGNGVSGTCKATDLGYTVPAPNIGRLASGKWVVLVPNGYFPDCSQATVPTGEGETSDKALCKAIAAQAPKDASGNTYSALFVLDAATGAMIAELKTPTNISGVSSYGLGSVALGDYTSDQIDDVAFAGDMLGNLWRFDLSDPSPSNWKVTLAYKGMADADGKQGVQPITVQPRLFPDPRSSRFLVVFGTGKYLGVGDNTTDIPVQSAYGIREMRDASGNPQTVTRANLHAQDLSESAGTGDLAGATIRKLTNTPLADDDEGWYIDFDLDTAKGERVVVTPGAIFASNTAIFQSLIPGSDNYCDPSTKGALMALEGPTGGAGSGVTMFGDDGAVGARVSNVSTTGTVPVVTRLGGGEQYVPVPIEGVEKTPTFDAPTWRRRSWSVLKSQ